MVKRSLTLSLQLLHNLSFSIFNPLYIAEISQKIFPKKPNFIHLTLPHNLDLLFNQLNNTSPEQNVDPENVVNSRYFDIDEIQSLKLHEKDKSLFFFHTTTCSLSKTLIICSMWNSLVYFQSSFF